MRPPLHAIIFASSILLCPHGAIAHSSDRSPAVAYTPDTFGGIARTHVVVRLRADAFARSNLRRARATADADALPLTSPRLRALAATWRASKMRRGYVAAFANPALAEKHGLDRTFVLEVPAGTDTEQLAKALTALSDEVELASPDVIGGVAADPLIPDDAQFNVQWALHNTGQSIQGGPPGTPDADIDAPEAWAIHTGNLGSVTVALLDSGLNSHPEFGNNVAPFPNGRVIQGYNTVLNSSDPVNLQDTCPHGTHIAGIVGASGNNAQGVAGLTWGAYLMPVKVLTNCSGFSTDLSEGIIWAADHGADVINMSLQYNLTQQASITAMQSAVNYAHDSGVLLVAATGNNDNCSNSLPPANDTVCFPARLLNVMAVSATDNNDALGTFSNYGDEVDVAAPGKDIRSTWTNGSYQYLFGTSMATPHVSGLAALIKSYVPDLTNDEIEEIIETSAEDRGDLGWDNHYGHGRINAGNALAGSTTGACCDRSALDCQDRVLEARCAGLDVEWHAGLECSQVTPICAPLAVPSVSEWGLVVLSLLGLVAGTLRFGGKSPTPRKE